MNRFETLLQQCDADIRQGRPHDAAKRLSRLKGARVPREMRLPLAKVCRRAGLLSLGLRLLSRIVNGTAGMEPTASEKAEYAVLLLRSGAVIEALQRLNEIDTDQVPDALLFRAYAHFALWEFKQAIPSLEHYLRAQLTPPALLVGRTNLAFAHAECRQHAEALKILDANIEIAQSQAHASLEDFNRAVRTQVYIQEGRFEEARKAINVSQARGTTAQTNDQFFTTKLDLILRGLETKSLVPFTELRSLAIEKHDWFALRDADLFALKVKFDLERFLHLYFGSPFAGFRDCIRYELGSLPDRQVYVLGPKKAPRFDLANGQLDGKDIIRVGGKCHQLIEVLLRDFYQPLRVGDIFSALFPSERYDIATSPDRVRQIIRRTREWIRDEQLPIAITEDVGFYSLRIVGDFSFRIPITRTSVDLVSLQLHELRNAFEPDKIFSTQELCAKLNLSTTSGHRLLRHALEGQIVERLGPVKRPLGYRIVSPSRRSEAA